MCISRQDLPLQVYESITNFKIVQRMNGASSLNEVGLHRLKPSSGFVPSLLAAAESLMGFYISGSSALLRPPWGFHSY